MTFTVRPLERRDCDALAAHVVAHAAESGRDGGPLFMPRARADRIDEARLRGALAAGLATPVGGEGWLRAWGAFLSGGAGRLVGHVDLRARPEPAAAHRAFLSVGVLASHRGRGIGAALVRAALAWARREPGLAFVDLGVFAKNEAALRLYRRLGFRENGRVVDLFRIDGESIDEVSMTLRLT